ncbi:Hsp20/alpha crystallin family protein [Pseudokordiimonas caeni]|uniref:Hsp20/alpha crystallin family protein n=1 Tax=Pseudokordiimonas caeni TaxID=2997908 RepID=UPI0028126280|nr:Hsp20/alpha crystallin family protein [Pseudokordiimonas caeni]
MASSNITPRGNGGRQVPSIWGRDPFESLHQDMDRLFRGYLTPSLRAVPMFPDIDVSVADFARMDVRETKDALDVKVDVPGMDVDDIDVRLVDNILTIKGERKTESEEKREDYYCSERSFGSFVRRFELPVDVEEGKIEASVKRGVLTVHLPKSAKAKAHEKKIAIKAS